jgi:hypothetical protein
MKRNWIIAAVVTLALGWWLYHWCQPERQVRRAQARLLSAAESGDFDSLALLIADDYRDGWGHDKAFVLRASRQVFPQFVLLSIEQEGGVPEPAGAQWILREKLTMEGMGSPIATMVRDRVNRLREPFTSTWRKRGWKPWDWELTSLEQPEISEREMDVHF